MRTVAVLTVLGFAAPALADVRATTPAQLSDSELDQVTAGGDTSAMPTTTTNINISPIVVTQTAVALSYQSAWTHPGKGKAKGKGKALGLVKQNATTTAFNYAVINYNVTF
jgi:hypothetical protein